MLSYDASLLSTQYVPGVHEITVIKARLEAQRQEIQVIDEEIATQRLIQSERYSRRVYLMQNYAVGKALLAPVRKLPVEVLEEIFVHSIPGLFLDDIETNNSDHPLHPDEEHPHDARTCLRLVCRRWQAVADAAPRVWSTIALDYSLPADIHILYQWFNRSKSRLVDLYIQPSSWFRTPHADRQHDVWELLLRELPRMRVFIAQTQYHNSILQLFPLEVCTEAPNLEVFGLICPDNSEDTYGEKDTGPIHAPILRSLILYGSEHTVLSFTCISLAALRRITTTLDIQPSRAYLPVLAECHNLEFMHWTDDCPYDEDIDSTATPLYQVTLPSLTQMVFQVEDNKGSTQFLRFLHVPALENLTIDASYTSAASPPALEMLVSLFRGGSAALQRLEVWHASIEGTGVIELLSGLVSLQSICIISCNVDPVFFHALDPPDNAFPPACPRLEFLIITDGWISANDFFHFLRRRTRSDLEQRAPGYLTSVEITECKDLEAEHKEEFLRLQETHSSTLVYVPAAR